METEEIIDVIDESGKIISSVVKSEIYNRKLPHAIAHVLIFDKKDLLACQVRALCKEYCPGCFSTSVGGHVSSGETPEEAAKREMLEEIGKEGSLNFLFSTWYEGEERIKKMLYVYTSETTPPFEINKHEVDRVEWLSINDLNKLPDSVIHPELKFIIKKFKDGKFKKITKRNS